MNKVNGHSKNGLPKGWNKVKMGDVFTIERGGSPRPIDQFITEDKDGINWIKIGDTKGVNKYISQTKEKIKPSGAARSRMVYEGDFVLSNSMSFGRPYIMKTSGCIHDGWLVIRQNEKVDKDFLYHSLNSNEVYNQFTKLAKGSTVKNLNIEAVKQVEIVLPPIEAQKQIVSKIEELFSELNKSKEQLKTAQQQLKVYRQSVLKWAFEGKLTNADVKKNGELPTGWNYLKLKDIVKENNGLRRGPFGSAIKKEFFVPDGYKVYEQGNAINDDPYRGKYFVDAKKYQELINFAVQPKDLIVSCSGVTLGRITEIPSDAKAGIINQALLRIRLKENIIQNKYFIAYFRSAFFQKKISAQSQGTAMPNLIGIKDFKEIDLVIPPNAEQEKVMEEIESRFSVADKLEETITNSLQQSEALRQSILKKAFEGKLD